YDRRNLGESGADVQVNQAAVEFSDRRGVFPAEAAIEGETRTEAPIVIYIRGVSGAAEVFIRVTEREGTGVGRAQEEVGEIKSGSCAGELETAPRILLREEVELLAADIAAGCDVVRPVGIEERSRQCVGLETIERGLTVGKAGKAGSEAER